ncbi:protein eva-1 homolog C isoform X1 [Exaiptasia diaphana]|uniref:SUEL-type lectin domain-containing protein n=1 Tax=Exaiptasia diaphana TaxID=2652724 RepID=A0A913Y0P5_EXADI|nr:protein eva-1 homolog C isoform X1 [Exaiptasia diaphana]
MKLLRQVSVKIPYAWMVMACTNFVVCYTTEDFTQMRSLRVDIFCENTTAKFSCDFPSLIQVKSASFGRASSDFCVTNRDSDWQPCDLVDKKELLKELCDYKNKCEVEVTEKIFGNKLCPDVAKYLNLVFACVQNPKTPKPFTTTTMPTTTTNTTTNHTRLTTNTTTMLNTTPTTTPTKPRTIPGRKIKKARVKDEKKPITFNPDGSVELDFLSNSSPSKFSSSVLGITVVLVFSFL